MYSVIRPLLFQFDPEDVHHFVTANLKRFNNLPGSATLFKALWQVDDARLQREVFGLKFKNPVGLAAGFDKNGDYISEMANLGFGFIEIGTVTPLPQSGNEKPRMFRLPADEALINRMGFNNHGVDYAAARIAEWRNNRHKSQQNILIGGNIGKNKNTPNEDAVKDYLACFDRLFDVVDYFVVNVSSPNTPGLRALQDRKPLTEILNALQQSNSKNGIRKPVLLKIAPDLTDDQLDDIIQIVAETKIDGLIATNTTVSREGLKSPEFLKKQSGGLSGKPLTNRSTEVIAYLQKKSNGSFPIIGAGGIHTAQDAIDKLNAGASLVQLYTGFIYQGPALISSINRKILSAR